MKIKLIAPAEHRETSISSAETFMIQKVSLPLLAALTPAGHAVKIVDESFTPDDVNENVDLVGITVLTELALSAYRVANAYRERGVKVVMGGIHSTVLPEEVLQHADAVVVGEAEKTWPQLVTDAAQGKMQKIYRASGMTDLNSLPLPKRDLYPRPISRGYTPFAVGVETARGCPYDCEFCSITQVMGSRLRTRAIDHVIAEIESIPSSNLFFVDDSLGCNRKIAKQLFAELIPLKRRWVGQATISLAEDIELLHLMRRSGCEGLLIGFESVERQIQDGMRKTRALKMDFSEAMRRFHGEGIAILGAFIFGFDDENKSVFDRTLEFITASRLEAIQLRILCPLPGTRLYKQLLSEGRLFDPKWWLREKPLGPLLFCPKCMTPEELLDGLNRTKKECYSLGSIINRFFGVSPWKRSVMGFSIFAGFNLAQRKRYHKDRTSFETSGE
jgi:radical SAM superfamily enzyme YgiQ (UPF0313 family)